VLQKMDILCNAAMDVAGAGMQFANNVRRRTSLALNCTVIMDVKLPLLHRKPGIRSCQSCDGCQWCIYGVSINCSYTVI
jgi:hypothetical protein